MSLARYERYRDSGVEWIGEIPEGWEVKKLKYCTNLLIDGSHTTPTYLPDGIPFLRVTDIQSKEIDLNNVKYIAVEEHELLSKRCNPEKDDVLLSKNGTIGITKVVDWDWEFSVFVSLCLIKLKKQVLNPKFFSAQFGSNVVDQQIVEGSKQTSVINLHLDKINELLVIIPPLPEQTAIASFLDRKTVEIDRLIANKEKLIALYEDEKTAIINRAVTKGLDPKVTTKPSGVDWLGDIPEHWEVKRLKYFISKLESGVSVNATDYPATGAEYGILKTSCVYNYNFNASENKAIWENELDRAKVSPRKGSIIISRMNTPDLVGASGYVDHDLPTLFLPDRLWQTVFWQGVEIDAKWLSYVLKCSSFRKLLSITATGTSPSMKNLGQEEFLNIAIPFMKIDEQTAIVTHIETECSRLDAIIEKFKKQIELFKEYRTTLISEVVTGKIDVRGEVAA